MGCPKNTTSLGGCKKLNGVYEIPCECRLNATGLEPLPEDLLEEGNVIEVHQGVVLAGHVSEGGTILTTFNVTTAETLPGLELLVHPISLRSFERNGVEDVQNLDRALGNIRFSALDQAPCDANPVVELGNR